MIKRRKINVFLTGINTSFEKVALHHRCIPPAFSKILMDHIAAYSIVEQEKLYNRIDKTTSHYWKDEKEKLRKKLCSYMNQQIDEYYKYSCRLPDEFRVKICFDPDHY